MVAWLSLFKNPNKVVPQKHGRGFAEERFAERYLLEQGLTLVKRNFIGRFGEIDLIMQERDVLVFVEVRQRKNSHFGSALESVSRSKQDKLKKTAELYLVQSPPPNHFAMRFDVIGLTGTLPNVQIEWIKNAF